MGGNAKLNGRPARYTDAPRLWMPSPQDEAAAARRAVVAARNIARHGYALDALAAGKITRAHPAFYGWAQHYTPPPTARAIASPLRAARRAAEAGRLAPAALANFARAQSAAAAQLAQGHITLAGYRRLCWRARRAA